ncbi:MAG TPA: response regulator [Caulobacteraceae bacterium]|jgi:CheY-like chemotaxis protein|nr:response regulator [Caulobacteraceae bacterium]
MTQLSVLYVDDEPDIREVAVISLELDPGIEVRTAASGAAALDALEDRSWAPAVILLDVMMPVLDGPGTLARLRQLPPHAATPVVFITARAQAHEQSRLLALGAVGVISKPFDPMSLATQLRAILADDRRS